jgi:hypothetical protein
VAEETPTSTQAAERLDICAAKPVVLATHAARTILTMDPLNTPGPIFRARDRWRDEFFTTNKLLLRPFFSPPAQFR